MVDAAAELNLFPPTHMSGAPMHTSGSSITGEQNTSNKQENPRCDGLDRLIGPSGNPLSALDPDKRDEDLTTEEWQDRLVIKQLAINYPQQFGKSPEIGTVSRLGLLESTGPLLGHDPVRLGKWKAISAVIAGTVAVTCLALMPETINGRPHMFSSVCTLQHACWSGYSSCS